MKRLIQLTIILSLLLTINSTSEAIEKQLSYQGRLTGVTGHPVADGLYSVDFILYTALTGGAVVWAENAQVSTIQGLFSYNIGSSNSLSSSLFQTYPDLFLELRISGEAILPRTQISRSAYAFSSAELSNIDSNGNPIIQTDSDNRSLTIYDSMGVDYITLQQKSGDSAVLFPDSSINADELLNEPGVTSSISINLITLTNSDMMDLTTVTIETPADGYVVLYGKCYLLLSGTTAANSAIVQIDENEGGGTQFPYYTIAGLSGYQNSGTNYFPVFITRVYYKNQGTYTFRLEAKANNPLPAVAQSWDHVLTAFYYPTSYRGVEAIVANPSQFEHVLPISSENLRGGQQQYKVDLRELELIDKAKK